MVGKGRIDCLSATPTAGHVAFIGTLREENVKLKEGALMLHSLRLKIDNQQISEIETFIVRSGKCAERREAGKATSGVSRNHSRLRANVARDLIKTANTMLSGICS